VLSDRRARLGQAAELELEEMRIVHGVGSIAPNGPLAMRPLCVMRRQCVLPRIRLCKAGGGTSTDPSGNPVGNPFANGADAAERRGCGCAWQRRDWGSTD
jgi:hypothetical protein